MLKKNAGGDMSFAGQYWLKQAISLYGIKKPEAKKLR
jgi:hypothetical protein